MLGQEQEQEDEEERASPIGLDFLGRLEEMDTDWAQVEKVGRMNRWHPISIAPTTLLLFSLH